jgi:drug/metabolite transporter (DMT)-like permease
VSPILLRYVKDFFSVNFQNFIRYLVSLLILWSVFILSHRAGRRAEELRQIPRLMPKILLISLFKYAFQVSFTYSLYLILPGVVTLVYQAGIPFAVFLAFAFFPDERDTLRSWKFLAGLALSMGGVALVIFGGPQLGEVSFNLGVLAVLASAASWAALSVLIRKWLPSVPPTLAISTVFTVVTPLYLITYAALAGGLILPKAPASMWIIMLISGILGVGIGQAAYYYAIKQLGLALLSSLQLLIPFLVGILSLLVYGESLALTQILGGLVLIAGSFVVIRIRFRFVREAGV